MKFFSQTKALNVEQQTSFPIVAILGLWIALGGTLVVLANVLAASVLRI